MDKINLLYGAVKASHDKLHAKIAERMFSWRN